MCIAAIAWDAHPDWLLVAAGNRDEFHARPSAPLENWGDGSGIIAGRDLEAGGTWLGVSGQGRFALITNVRVDGHPQPGRPSRGGLVTQVLAGEEPKGLAAYNPFNLLLAGPAGASVLSNHPSASRHPLASGLHGVSNGAFDAPWPKTRQLCSDLGTWLEQGDSGMEPLFDALRRETPDSATARAEDGPEPVYAPVFIRNPVYGTRCSTVIAIRRDGAGAICERRFDTDGSQTGESLLAFRWPG